MSSALVYHCETCYTAQCVEGAPKNAKCKRHQLAFVESELFNKYIETVRNYEEACALNPKKVADGPYDKCRQKAKRAWRRAYRKRVKADKAHGKSDLVLRSAVPYGATPQEPPQW